ncbi:hotdog fold domain-containing protein [Nocardioides sp. NPDC057767]|uniref:hotdog fold domain-containing protein n=1 Tax=Nocardioides TaxID=1839 RepID=UPI0002028A75|nr:MULTISPECIES: hotdog fold domain-containing protein [Nocardioides]EGD40969.1 thioesterase [Nocardioidaceae bacterium Broad-1]MBG6098625.1 acyl-coenzyme A thioesterase PaaI-like protein [Nocardioides luteus]
MSQLYDLWKSFNRVPVVGKRAFSVAFAKKAPYFGSIHPLVNQLRPNYAEVIVPNRKGNHNHIGTVHAIALCNGLEMAMGALAEVTIPRDKRWIPKGMTVSYTAKATSDITCIAETDQEDWETADGDLAVRVKGIREDGTVVIEGTINLWVTPKKK